MLSIGGAVTVPTFIGCGLEGREFHEPPPPMQTHTASLTAGVVVVRAWDGPGLHSGGPVEPPGGVQVEARDHRKGGQVFVLPDDKRDVPLFRGERPQPPLRHALVHHSFDGMFSVRRGPWKLVDGLGSGGFSEPARYEPKTGGPYGQLYHLVNDSRETANLWLKNTAVVEELLDALRNQA